MKIITSVVNNPIFIEIQYYTLKKFFKGEYEFIVFNDAKDFPDFTNGNDITIKSQINETCNTLNIKCINIENNHHKYLDMSRRHADTFNNHVVRFQLQNPDKYILLDSDMFLVDYFDIDKYSKYHSAIVLQTRNNEGYLWPGLCYFDMTKMKNFELIDWSLLPGFDSGGMTKEWLKKQLVNTPIPDPDKIRWSDNEFHTNDIYFIKKGKIKKYKTDKEGREQIFYLCKSGEFLGYHALLCDEFYTDTASTLEECAISFIPKDDFLLSVASSSILSNRLLKCMSHEFGALVNILTMFAQRSVRERLALCLLVIRDKFKKPDQGNKPVEINLTRQDLAKMVGTARETLTRLLADFKTEGLIASEGRKIILKKPLVLSKIANIS